uniref:Uncharacterized protein n=1 Tax=Plectus sambesii TaxID=2011161 RepID=A0A914X1S1_9BILA
MESAPPPWSTAVPKSDVPCAASFDSLDSMVSKLKKGSRPRLVSKNGTCLLKQIDRPQRHIAQIRNWFHLLIENTWRRILMLFASSFLISWVVFACIYSLIAFISGDFHDHHFEGEHEYCIQNVHNFITAFLFSVESQHTIGYGYRYITSACPPAYITLFVQLIVGVLIQTLIGGVVLAKLLRPKKRLREIRYSLMGVIAPLSSAFPEDYGGEKPDHRNALMFRIADICDKLHLCEPHVRLYMARTRINKHGQKELIGMRDMDVGYDNGRDRLLLIWPVIVVHMINEKSPLFGMTRETLAAADFELIMTVEGIVEATGMTFQARTSYLPDEIQWGYRFAPIVRLNEQNSRFQVQYSLFDYTIPVDMEQFLQVETINENDDDDRPNPSGLH